MQMQSFWQKLIRPTPITNKNLYFIYISVTIYYYMTIVYIYK